MSNSSDHQLTLQRQRIEELERAVGRKQIKVDVLEKTLELAEQEYDLDLKKNIGGRPSAGSASCSPGPTKRSMITTPSTITEPWAAVALKIDNIASLYNLIH